MKKRQMVRNTYHEVDKGSRQRSNRKENKYSRADVLLRHAKDGDNSRRSTHTKLIAPTVLFPSNTACDVRPVFFLAVLAEDLLLWLRARGTPGDADHGNQLARQEIPSPYLAVADVGRTCRSTCSTCGGPGGRHLVAGNHPLLTAAQDGLDAKLLVPPRGIGVGTQTGAVLAVHEAQTAVERADEDGAAVAGEGQAGDAGGEDVDGAAAHAHVVGAEAAVDAAGQDLGPADGEAGDGVAGVVEDLDRFGVAGLGVPDADGGVDAAGEHERVGLAGELDAVDAGGVAVGCAAEAAGGRGGGDVPEEDGAVAATGDEALVVGCYVQREDFVPVGGVGLDETALGDGGRRGRGFGRDVGRSGIYGFRL